MLGGGGSSSSNQTETNQIDKRMVIESGIGISSDSSTVSVQALDGGAVSAALNANVRAFQESANVVNAATAAQDATSERMYMLSGQALTGAAATISDVLGVTSRVYERAFTALDKSGRVIEGAGSLVATAYDDARGDQKQRSYIAIAALAVVAVVAFGGRK